MRSLMMWMREENFFTNQINYNGQKYKKFENSENYIIRQETFNSRGSGKTKLLLKSQNKERSMRTTA